MYAGNLDYLHPRSVDPVLVGQKGIMKVLGEIYARVFRSVTTYDTLDEALGALGIQQSLD